MEQIVFRADPLAKLATATTYQEKLAIVHGVLKKRCSGIDRISIALYDNQTHSLKTFIASPVTESPLKNYESTLTAKSILSEIHAAFADHVVEYRQHLQLHGNIEC